MFMVFPIKKVKIFLRAVLYFFDTNFIEFHGETYKFTLIESTFKDILWSFKENFTIKIVKKIVNFI